MRWLKLTVAYEGTNYAGWQWQPSEPTIQGALQRAWKSVTGEEIKLIASGRTDAGVHALGQVVGVSTASTIPAEQMPRALNANLPNDIVVVEAVEAHDGFHATHDALRKTYRYQIYNSRIRPLMDRRYVWHVPTGELDTDRMGQGGAHLVGRHDFVSLESSGSERSSTVRTILDLKVHRHDEPNRERIDITVTGDGFLYNMVRTIAGTLVEVGKGNHDPDWVAEVIAARDRRRAGPTAPPEGLVLVSVDY